MTAPDGEQRRCLIRWTARGWRGTLYAPDGVTPSMSTPLMPTRRAVVCRLAACFYWLRTAGLFPFEETGTGEHQEARDH